MPSAKRGSGRRTGASRSDGRGTLVSKKLSWLLRHGAIQVGVEMHSGGWVNVADVLKWNDAKSIGMTFEEIKAVVDSNEKKRFQLVPTSMVLKSDAEATTGEPAITDFLFLDVDGPNDADRHIIRATQGHSIKAIAASDLLDEICKDDVPAKCPELVVHGTTPTAWEQIRKSGGLKIMSRQHVHFAAKPSGGPEKVVSGMRKSASVLIWVDVSASMESMSWWLSANGVILTSGIEGVIPLKFVSKVERRREGLTDLEVIWTPAADE